jgi:hypothetical protein
MRTDRHDDAEVVFRNLRTGFKIPIDSPRSWYKNILKTSKNGPRLVQESGSHLQNRGARRATRSKFHTDDGPVTHDPQWHLALFLYVVGQPTTIMRDMGFRWKLSFWSDQTRATGATWPPNPKHFTEFTELSSRALLYWPYNQQIEGKK